MGTTNQYFKTDFDYCLRVKIKHDFSGQSYEGAILYDPSAKSAFLAFYLPQTTNNYAFFLRFLASLKHGETQLKLDDGVVLPRHYPGQLHVQNSNPLEIHYQFFGDPSWKKLTDIQTSSRIFLYCESNLEQSEITNLQIESNAIGHDLQFRSGEHTLMRSKFETPLAFISHDSRDKELIARPIALNLQNMLCPVWYDEFSLKVGDNLRQSIEEGLKKCRKCVLILSKNFFANNGWGKREFDSIFTREILEEEKLVLPVWYGITKKDVYEYSPSLLNVMGINWNSLGEKEVCRLLYNAIFNQKK